MFKDEIIDIRLTRLFETSAKVMLSMLVAVLLAATLAAIAHAAWDLRLVLRTDFHQAFKVILLDVLMVLAIVEILRTALAYFSEGRVKVTYIIDTVIVTVLSEVAAFWYRDMGWEKIGMVIGMVIALVLSLAVARVIAVRFSPRGHFEK